jgi:hypothetical protein
MTIKLDPRDLKNGELQTFMYMIEQGALKEVAESVYSDFINQHIKKNDVPCRSSLIVKHMRKRIGACYVELLEEQSLDGFLGIGPDPYIKKYPEQFACYGWLELEDGQKNFFLNPKLYPSWFSQNVAHFDAHRRKT